MHRYPEKNVHSLIVLMIETEQPEGLSARKLVVETAKHNVLTTYSGMDGLEMLRRFPNVDTVMVHGFLPTCEDVIDAILKMNPAMPVIVASPVVGKEYAGATYVIPSHSPAALLEVLATKFGASLDN